MIEAERRMTEETPGLRGKFQVPRIIKRNTVFLALSQAFVGPGTQLIPALGSLAVLQLTGSTALAGLSIAIVSLSRLLVAYPAGKISDDHGRKPVLFLGLLSGMAGGVLVGLAIQWSSLAMLLAAFFVFGMGIGVINQIRVAAADMYPPSRRGLGMGYVLTGSLAGIFIAPLMIAFAQRMSPRVGIDPLGLPWFFVPVLTLPALFLILRVRPDPQEIAMNMGRHYPGEPSLAISPPTTAQPGVTPVSLLRNYPRLAAIVAGLAVQGNMSMMMLVTPLVLHDHGHGLAAISLSVSVHVVGMYGFSVPIGWLSDRLGRRAVLLGGVVTAGAGSLIVPWSQSYWMITAGTFFVGLGWSAVFVAANCGHCGYHLTGGEG